MSLTIEFESSDEISYQSTERVSVIQSHHSTYESEVEKLRESYESINPITPFSPPHTIVYADNSIIYLYDTETVKIYHNGRLSKIITAN